MSRVAALGLGLAGSALLLLAASPAPATFDECSFQAALSAWDLLAFEPHFPGYPVAVLAARLASAAGATAPYAAVVAALLPLAALLLHRGAGGGAGGLLAAGLLALCPLLLREGARPMADGTGTLLLAAALATAVRRDPAALSGLFMGLAAGARPDLLPWLALGPALALDAPAGRRARTLAWFAAGAAGPLLLALSLAAAGAGGPESLLAEGARFLRGHLLEWGGGVGAAAPPAAGRLELLLAPGEALGGAGWLRAPGLALLLLLALRAPRRLRRGAVLAGLPYLLWLVLAQNPDQPRHALPLLPPLLLLAGGGLVRLRARAVFSRALVAALLLGAATGALATAQALRHRARPGDLLSAWAARLDPLRVRVYAGASGRVLRARVPFLDVRRARDLAGLRLDLAADPGPRPLVLVLSEVGGAADLPRVATLEQLAVHALPEGAR